VLYWLFVAHFDVTPHEVVGHKTNLEIGNSLIADAALAGLNKRFQGYDTRHDLILASVTLPQFRIRWLEDDDKKSQARNLLYEQLRVVQQQQQLDLQLVSNDNQESVRAESDDDYFSFGGNTRQNTDATAEVDMYLCSLGDQILTPRKNRLTDAHFQRQLLLRANKSF